MPSLAKRKITSPSMAQSVESSSRMSSSSSSFDPQDDEDEYRAGPSTTRKPAKPRAKTSNARGLSKEARRKANHSLIERRRREKINAALDDLREMVPGLGDTGGKAGEFKLEVLERTVLHMRELKARLVDLEGRTSMRPPANANATGRKPTPPTANGMSTAFIDAASQPSSSSSPPTARIPKKEKSASVLNSPDPDETESEAGILPSPPGYVPSSQPQPPSITSLLATATSTMNSHKPPPATRPLPGPDAPNPNLYLPFPTPSPTSPFLSYNGSSASSSNTIHLPDPSPFIAPLSNISLFGGALNLDSHLSDDTQKEKGMEAEEAANVLLAFSSPDTLRPIGAGMTPKMIPVNGDEKPTKKRRSTLESEDFVLDGGTISGLNNGKTNSKAGIAMTRSGTPVGKTARDILRM